jgi:LmbE family N-acetylglucosaminyl deacetylase
MHWIYISPHLDDVALSCGGLIWEQIRAGDTASVWTICAGDPPAGPLSAFAEELHTRWQVDRQAVAIRRREDLASCAILGAGFTHFDVPDCIYRQSPIGEFLYASEEALSSPLHPAESEQISKVVDQLLALLPTDARVVCPLALGHIDHALTRAAVEKLNKKLWYYADYPYVLRRLEEVAQLESLGWKANIFPVSMDGLTAWQQSVAAHVSQVSTFWRDLPAMYQAVQEYLDRSGGAVLWQPLTGDYDMFT